MKILILLAMMCAAAVTVAELNYIDDYTFLGTSGGINYFQRGGGAEPVYNYLIAEDFSGNGNDGTCSSANILTLNGSDWEGNFNGVDEYIEATLNGSYTDVTIALWVKLSSDQTGFLRLAGWEDGMEIWRSTSTLAVNYSLGVVYAGNIVVASSEVLKVADGWTHVAATKSGSDWKLYKNGLIIGSGTQALSWVNKEFNIGKRAGFMAEYVDGTFDDTLVYPSALTSNQVFNLYDSDTMPPNDEDLNIEYQPKEVE